MKIIYWTPNGVKSFRAISATHTRTGIRFALPSGSTKTIRFTAIIHVSDAQNMSYLVKQSLP